MGNAVVHGSCDKPHGSKTVDDMEFLKSKASHRRSCPEVDVDFKARLQHKLYLAKEDPSEEYDLAECNLKHVPNGTYSLCKVLRKEILLLNNNCLVNLSSGGNLSDLSHLRILNLSHNALEKLPEEISFLQQLKALYLDYNNCKRLPESLGTLRNLEIFSISHNKLKELPSSLGLLEGLSELDLSYNRLTRLPPRLSQLTALKRFSCEGNNFDAKLFQVCQEGWDSVQIFLLIEYELERDATAESRVTDIKSKVVPTQPVDTKAKLLKVLSNDETKFQEQLQEFQRKQEASKRLLLENLAKQEENAQSTVKSLLSISQMHKDSTVILAMLEREQEQINRLLQVRDEEYATLRKAEVMKYMQNQLEEELQFMRRPCKVLNANDEFDNLIEKVLQNRQSSRDEMFEQLTKDETLQKQAFVSLLSRKDERGRLLQSQIEVVVQELSSLSLQEIQRKESKLQSEMDTLCTKRQELAELLNQLLEQQQERRRALQAFLLELELQRASQAEDYWLLQFQRLLDSKPKNPLTEGDEMTREILKAAGALEYELLLEVRGVSLGTGHWTDARLKEVGIGRTQARTAILQLLANRTEAGEGQILPSAPELELEPSAPSLDLLQASGDLACRLYLESACVVCLDRSCQLLFLACGHVCCCTICGKPLELCPMCRSRIAQKVCLSN